MTYDIWYHWHGRDIIGDLETLNPGNYFEAIRAISSLMHDLISVQPVLVREISPNFHRAISRKWCSYTTQSGPVPPSGDTIMAIVGPTLLRSVNLPKSDTSYDKGVAEAIKALVQLFSSRFNFQGLYLAAFYRGLSLVIYPIFRNFIEFSPNFFMIYLKFWASTTM